MGYPKIYFNERLHKYTDEYGNVLTSVTTVIGKYIKPFDTDAVVKACVRIGKNPNHPKHKRYKNKTEKQILKEWKDLTDEALDKGNNKHNFLEDAIKASNNYNRVEGKFINDRIFTIPDIISNPIVGVVTIDKLIELGLDSKYPIIFSIISKFVENGWKLYSEIGVFSEHYLISGLIDLLLVRDDEFIILDWKTNKSPIKFEAGYFEKDLDGNMTDNFIRKDEKLLYPINYLEASTGNKYSLQLSGYGLLTEGFNLKLKGIILCHIRDIDNKEVVNPIPIRYMKRDIKKAFDHHLSNINLTSQKRLFT